MPLKKLETTITNINNNEQLAHIVEKSTRSMEEATTNKLDTTNNFITSAIKRVPSVLPTRLTN